MEDGLLPSSDWLSPASDVSSQCPVSPHEQVHTESKMVALAGYQQNVVVVGGGIVGASISWHLQAQGANVTVVAEDIGGTATPNSFAWINAAYGNPKFYFDLRHRSMGHWRELGGDGQLPDLPIHWGGSLSWDMPPEELETYLEQSASWGYDVIRVDNSEISEREPAFEERALPEWGWGVHASEEGSVEPEQAARYFLSEAKARGAHVLEAEVTGFIKGESGRRISGVVMASGDEVRADHVVLAAGFGSVALLAAEGITLPVTEKEGLLIHTKPTRPLLNGITYAKELHMRQTLDGRILAGVDEAGGDPGEDPQRTAEQLLAKVKEALKGTDDLELDYYTVGRRPTPADGYPILGDTGLEGLSLAVMHSGVSLAPVVGQLISQLVLAGKADPALADFSLARFSNLTSAS